MTMKYEYDSYARGLGAHVQGRLHALVVGAAGRDNDARERAVLAAQGWPAAQIVRSYPHLRGLRVVRAAFCR